MCHWKFCWQHPNFRQVETTCLNSIYKSVLINSVLLSTSTFFECLYNIIKHRLHVCLTGWRPPTGWCGWPGTAPSPTLSASRWQPSVGWTSGVQLYNNSKCNLLGFVVISKIPIALQKVSDGCAALSCGAFKLRLHAVRGEATVKWCISLESL